MWSGVERTTNPSAKEAIMRTTRIDIEGDRGRATIFRSGSDIVINVTRRSAKPDDTIRLGIGHEDSWLVGCRDHAAQQGLAVRLQKTLDGHAGTAGDVADYQRVIETFAD
jgi:hypothetical protein